MPTSKKKAASAAKPASPMDTVSSSGPFPMAEPHADGPHTAVTPTPASPTPGNPGFNTGVPNSSPSTPTTGVDHVDIYDVDTFVRTYSREVHGDNFLVLADQFIAGHPNCRKV